MRNPFAVKIIIIHKQQEGHILTAACEMHYGKCYSCPSPESVMTAEDYYTELDKQYVPKVQN